MRPREHAGINRTSCLIVAICSALLVLSCGKKGGPGVGSVGGGGSVTVTPIVPIPPPPPPPPPNTMVVYPGPAVDGATAGTQTTSSFGMARQGAGGNFQATSMTSASFGMKGSVSVGF